MKIIKEVILSKTGLLSISMIIGGMLLAELAYNKISDSTGAEIVSFALIMVSVAGTSTLVHALAEYNKAQENEEKKSRK